jgi:hypothetical protein
MLQADQRRRYAALRRHLQPSRRSYAASKTIKLGFRSHSKWAGGATYDQETKLPLIFQHGPRCAGMPLATAAASIVSKNEFSGIRELVPPSVGRAKHKDKEYETDDNSISHCVRTLQYVRARQYGSPQIERGGQYLPDLSAFKRRQSERHCRRSDHIERNRLLPVRRLVAGYQRLQLTEARVSAGRIVLATSWQGDHVEKIASEFSAQAPRRKPVRRHPAERTGPGRLPLMLSTVIKGPPERIRTRSPRCSGAALWFCTVLF